MPRFFSIAPPPENEDVSPRSVWTRIAWFIGLSCASGAAVAIVAYALRATLFL